MPNTRCVWPEWRQYQQHQNGSPTCLAATIRPERGDRYSRPDLRAFLDMFCFQEAGLQGHLRAPLGGVRSAIVNAMNLV